MSARVRVWCLRHAEAETVATGTAAVPTTPLTVRARHQDIEADQPLTVRGRHQAIEAARQLAAEPITRIYSSTLLRARQTADLLAATLGLPTTAMPELIEVGCTADVLRAWVVERELGRRATDGETGQQVVARVTAAFQQIAGAHPGETVLLADKHQEVVGADELSPENLTVSVHVKIDIRSQLDRAFDPTGPQT
jgi:broad specificity phosphatase PhoE